MSASKLSLTELAEHTPDTRDRYVDFIRAFSILTVVLGHWFIGVIWWQGGIIKTTNAIGVTSWMWLATWVFQVMPLFFFVGGFSNIVTYESYKRRGLSTGEFLRTRAMRLLKPSFVFLGAWAVAQVGLHLLDIGAGTGFKLWDDTWFLRGMLPPGATVPFGPLWFLPAYLVVILLAPVMIRLHRLFGIWIVVALVSASAAVDVAGFIGGLHGVRYLNVLFIWLLPHQIGFFYGDGRMQQMSKRALAVMAAAGLAGLTLLTNPPIFFGHGQEWFGGLHSYPKSLLGTEAEPIANTYPPTLVMVAMCFWAIGVAMLLRKPATRWLERSKRAWMGTIYVNSVIMTLYLWHMTAYLLAILVMWPFGIGHEHDSTAAWWWQRILFEVVPALFLAVLLMVFGRFERPKPRPTPPG